MWWFRKNKLEQATKHVINELQLLHNVYQVKPTTTTGQWPHKTRSTEKTNISNFGTKKWTKKLTTVIRQKKIQKRTKHRKICPNPNQLCFKQKHNKKRNKNNKKVDQITHKSPAKSTWPSRCTDSCILKYPKIGF